MPAIDLVTAVPDLHTARILAAAGVPYISFLQTTPNLSEIISWIEGPEVLVQIIDANLPIPQVDHLIIPYEWYDQFYFIDKKIWWMTSDPSVSVPDGMIYTQVEMITSLPESNASFYHFNHVIKNDGSKLNSWLDVEKDVEQFEAIFL